MNESDSAYIAAATTQMDRNALRQAWDMRESRITRVRRKGFRPGREY